MAFDPQLIAIWSIIWKIIATAGIVIFLGRLAWSTGPIVTSILLALPLNIGPGLFLISLTQDNEFIVRAALYGLAGGGAVLVYLTGFIRTAMLGNFYIALLIGLTFWFLMAWPIATSDLSFIDAVLFFCVGTLLVFIFCHKKSTSVKRVASPASWKFLIIRGLVAGCFIAGIVVTAPMTGPAVAGILLSFPTTLFTTGWMLQGHYGLEFVTATYQAASKALVLYAMFCAMTVGLASVVSGPLAILLSFGSVGALGAVFSFVAIKVKLGTYR